MQLPDWDLRRRRHFAEAGASVVLADWNEKEVQAAANDLASRGHKALGVLCDVSDDAQVEAMVKDTVATFGRLDAAYNNADIQNVLAETADSPRDDYDRVMAINLRGVWSCNSRQRGPELRVPGVSSPTRKLGLQNSVPRQ